MASTLVRCASCHNDVAASAAACPRCGSTEFESPGAPAVSAPQQLATSPFVKPWIPTRTFWIVCLSIAAAIVLLVAVSAILRATIYSPRAAVQRYFDALSAHDQVAAAAAQEDSTAVRAAGKLLQSKDYRAPEDLRVGKVTLESGDHNGVAAINYTVDGKPVSSKIRVVKSSERAFATFDQWKVADAFGALDIAGSPTMLLINGQQLATDSPVLYPGGYRVTTADNPLVTVEPVTVNVPVNGAGRAAIKATLKEGAQAKFVPVVKTYVDGCVEKLRSDPSGAPDDCPFLSGVYSEDITIDAYPTTQLAVTDGAITVTTTTPGQLTSGSGWGEDTQLPFELSGFATTDGGAAIRFVADR
ncbi:hypothetical protein [Microlunatus soli]|uniref:Uncharacterized protein n=1 Tax=Microlunatus soli TaxID=630515 RepID=A0A1H1T1I8_9ACTN|nr:hypothetical protein [Microlunatus soli]SDS54008.1 hypothetical protein SAMN04489812_2216 [Microlunatus soli]